MKGTLVLPKITAPAASSRSTMTELAAGMLSLHTGLPKVVGSPARSNDSLTVIGTPWSGPHFSPLAKASSAALARSRALSICRTMIALSLGLCFSARARKKSRSSTQPIFRSRMSAASRVAEAKARLSMGGSGGHDFDDMAVRVVEIDPTSTAAMVDVAVGARARPAAIADPRRLHSAENLIELGLADHEGVVVRLELAALVEIERQPVIDLHRCEMRMRALVFEPEDTGEELGRGDFVVRRDDGVVEDDGHRRLS